MYKCRARLANVHFRNPKRTEFGGVKDIVATIESLEDISAAARKGGPTFELVTEDDPDHPGERRQVIRVHPPTEKNRARPGMGPYDNGFEILYQLPTAGDPAKNFTIIGIAFKRDSDGGVGELEFPLVSINRDDDASEMAITDKCERPQTYTYGIVMQHIKSGTLGIFDPGIENRAPD